MLTNYRFYIFLKRHSQSISKFTSTNYGCLSSKYKYVIPSVPEFFNVLVETFFFAHMRPTNNANSVPFRKL